MILKTGIGYVETIDGRKISKFDLPIGEHPESIQGHKFIEVATRSELEKINLDKKDHVIEHEDRLAKRNILVDQAKTKLKKLGLTDEEITALTGH